MNVVNLRHPWVLFRSLVLNIDKKAGDRVFGSLEVEILREMRQPGPCVV